MITEIDSPKIFNYRIYIAPFFAISTIFFGYLIIYPDPKKNVLVESLLALLTCMLMFSIVLFIIYETIYVPNGIIINDDLKQLTLKYQFAKEKVISIDDISAYKDVRIRTRGEGSPGIVIYLSNKKPIVFSNINLNDFMPVKNFLDDSKIENIGAGKFSWLMYFTHQ